LEVAYQKVQKANKLASFALMNTVVVIKHLLNHPEPPATT
jgi:hypothetical protein